MNRAVMEKLAFFVKKNNAPEFLKLSNQIQILNMIPRLDDGPFIRILNFYSKLKINDFKSWKTLETTFLSKSHNSLLLSDYVNIAFCFSKNSQNPQLWKFLEEQIMSRFSDFKKDLLFSQSNTEKCDLGITMYSFYKAKYDSEKLWSAFEKIVVDSYHLLNQKNISMILMSFESMRRPNEKVIEALEMAALQRKNEVTTQNMVVICFYLAKMNRGSPVFWLKWETMIFPILDKLQAKDLCQVMWAFAKMRAGSDELWESFEVNTLRMCMNFSLLDFNNAIFSFLLKERNSLNLWRTFENYVKTKDFSLELKEITSKTMEEFLFISHVFYQRKSTDPGFWEKLGNIYLKFIKFPALFKCTFKKFNYHTGILSFNKAIWDEKLETLFKEMIIERANDLKYIKYIIDMIYLVYFVNANISESYYLFLLDKLLKLDLKTMTDNSDISGTVMMCCLFMKRYHDKNNEVYEQIINFLINPMNVGCVIKGGKALSLLLRIFSNAIEEQRFWAVYCKFLIENKEKLRLGMNILSNLIISILERNGIGFNFELHGAFNKKIESIFSNNKRKFEIMLGKVATLLLEGQKFKDLNEVQTALEIPEIDLNEFTKTYEKIDEHNLEEFKPDMNEIERNI